NYFNNSMRWGLAVIANLCAASLVLHGAAKEKNDPGPTVTNGEVGAWVAKRVQERQTAAQDRRFDEIGRGTDPRTGTLLGKEHNRPIFLFTRDGRINTGRC